MWPADGGESQLQGGQPVRAGAAALCTFAVTAAAATATAAASPAVGCSCGQRQSAAAGILAALLHILQNQMLNLKLTFKVFLTLHHVKEALASQAADV
jgi:hypothetical protein